MLELRTGEPGWYRWAVAGVVLLLLAVLMFNSIQYEYAVVVFTAALVITGCDCLVRERRAKYTHLLVGPDFSLALLHARGEALSAENCRGCWVSSRMIIIPLRIASRGTNNVVISRKHNDPEAFRRFTIICRFGFAVNDSEGHNVTQLNPQGNMK